MFEKLDRSTAPQRQRRLPLPAHPPADRRAHRRGTGARRHRRRAGAPVERARAHGRPGARPRADGHARRRAAPPGSRSTPTATATTLHDKLLRRCRAARWRRPCCATGAAPTRRSRGARGGRAGRRQRARAPSARSCCCRRSSLLARGAPRRRPAAAEALRRRRIRARSCWRAQVALAPTPAVATDEPLLTQRVDDLQTWVAVHPHDATGVDHARPGLGPPRPAVAIAACRRRGRARARRPAGRGRPIACRPAPRAQRRRPGRLHRRVGDRCAAARHRGAAQASSPPTRRDGR